MSYPFLHFVGGVALAAGSVAAAAANLPPRVLEPSSKWNLDYSDDSCKLGRKFGAGDDQMFFYIERFEPGDRFFLVVAGKPIGTSPKRITFLRFGPAGSDEKSRFIGYNGEYGTYGPAVMVGSASLMELPGEKDPEVRRKLAREGLDTDVFGQELTPAEEKSIEWIDVRSSEGHPVRLALGAMDQPLAAMRACTDELLTHWGLDLTAIRGMTRTPVPIGSPGDWITFKDYPREALRNNQQALVNFRMMVDAEGRPTSCHIQQVTTTPEFAEVTCRSLMKHAKFKPALGADGQPIAAFWRSSVNFQTFAL